MYIYIYIYMRERIRRRKRRKKKGNQVLDKTNHVPSSASWSLFSLLSTVTAPSMERSLVFFFFFVSLLISWADTTAALSCTIFFLFAFSLSSSVFLSAALVASLISFLFFFFSFPPWSTPSPPSLSIVDRLRFLFSLSFSTSSTRADDTDSSALGIVREPREREIF